MGDTIKKMKANVENMENEMDRLQRNIEKISDCSEQLDGTLNDRKEKIEELSGLQTLLHKQQFVFELPMRLNKAIELEAYSQAVKFWNSSSTILDKYNHLPSYRSIRKESEEIVRKLAKTLRLLIHEPTTDGEETAEFIGYLLDLGEKKESVRDVFLGKQGKTF